MFKTVGQVSGMPSAQKTYLASHAAPTRRPIAAMKAARPRQFAIKALTRDHVPPAGPVLTLRNRSSRAPSHCWTGHASSQRGLVLTGARQSIAAPASGDRFAELETNKSFLSTGVCQ